MELYSVFVFLPEERLLYSDLGSTWRTHKDPNGYACFLLTDADDRAVRRHNAFRDVNKEQNETSAPAGGSGNDGGGGVMSDMRRPPTLTH